MSSLRPWVQRIVLTSAFVAAFNCFSRADYNLPLYIFAYMAWGLQRSQKPRIAWMLLITLMFDVLWILFWGPFWNSTNFAPDYWENGMHSFVLILSLINAVLKFVLVILAYLTEIEVKKSFTISGIQEGLLDFLSIN